MRVKTQAEAERKAGEMNGKVPLLLAAGKRFYVVDQSPATGAWRVIEYRQVSFDQTVRKVVAS